VFSEILALFYLCFFCIERNIRTKIGFVLVQIATHVGIICTYDFISTARQFPSSNKQNIFFLRK